MNYDEKIEELNGRVTALEKIEKRRKIISGIKIGVKVLILIVIGIFVYKAYSVIQTYKQKLDELQKYQEKINDSENYIQEQLDKVKDLNPFN